MSKTRAYVSLVLGALGVLLWLAIVVIVWRVVPPVADGVAETAESIRSSVGGVEDQLGGIDGALSTAGETLATFRKEHAADSETMREKRQELAEALAPTVGQVRDDLEAMREAVLSIDRLLETLDLPFLDTARRVGAEHMEAIRERVARLQEEIPQPGEAVVDLAAELEPAQALVGEVRLRVGGWRATLGELGGELKVLAERAPKLAIGLCLTVTLLGLWSIAGMVCLIRAGRRALQT